MCPMPRACTGVLKLYFKPWRRVADPVGFLWTELCHPESSFVYVMLSRLAQAT